jgi:hypothetical protein
MTTRPLRLLTGPTASVAVIVRRRIGGGASVDRGVCAHASDSMLIDALKMPHLSGVIAPGDHGSGEHRVSPQKGGHVIADYDFVRSPMPNHRRDAHDSEHDPCHPAETTGEILLSWGPNGPAMTAPEQAAIPALELFGMRRVPGDPGQWNSRARSRIGRAHRRWPGAVYLHRLQ